MCDGAKITFEKPMVVMETMNSWTIGPRFSYVEIKVSLYYPIGSAYHLTTKSRNSKRDPKEQQSSQYNKTIPSLSLYPNQTQAFTPNYL